MAKRRLLFFLGFVVLLPLIALAIAAWVQPHDGAMAAVMVVLAAVTVAWGLRRYTHPGAKSVKAALTMESLLESTTDGVVGLDRDWRIVFANQRARSIIPDRLTTMGQNLWEAFPELVGTEAWTRCHHTMDTQEPCEFEIVGPLTGRWYFVRVFASREGLAIFFQDATARKTAEQERERVEEALRRSEERLSFALRCAQAGVFDTDLRNGAIEWSAESYRLFGLEPGRRVDIATWASLLHPEDRDAVLVGREKVLTSRQSDYRLDYRILRPDGQVCWISMLGRITYGEDGAPVRASGLYIDMTERKEVEEALRRSEERLSLALAAAEAGTFDWDVRSGRVNWSARSHEIFGLAVAKNEGSRETWLNAIYPEDRDRVQAAWDAAAAEHRPDFQVEYRVVQPDGSFRWVLGIGRITYADDGSATRMVGLDIDTTVRKQMEEELLAAKHKAEQANLAKSKFLAAASHDLRQPLQSLFLFAAVLRKELQTERASAALDTLERNLDILKGLLDSLLDISRLDAEIITPNIEDFEIDSLLDHIGASFSPIAAGRGLDFKLDLQCNTIVRSDRQLLARMIHNLVENAIKYTEHGSVCLECTASDGVAHVEVRDTGIGIATDQQDLIFAEFHQVANPERDRRKGLGLGLSIVQRLSKLLDHPVSLRSTLGQGSAFCIDVPLGDAEAARPSETTAALPATGRGKLVVLIDDEQDVLDGLCAALNDWGYQTITASSAEQALERLDASGRVPAAIVSDYRLRENRTGVDAIRLIRERAGGAIPGLILTGETKGDLRAEAEGLGLGILIKPITPRQLHDALKQFSST